VIISGSARLAGVMGWPVAHSASPCLHGFWLERYGIDGAYVPLAVSPGNLVDCLRALPLLGFAGVNLTLPHKETAIAVVDTLSASAEKIGAVNTVVIDEGGKLCGDNTDAYGFIENLKEGAPQWRAKDGPAVVIGAGGAARAVCVALADAGVEEIRIVNRTRRRAEQLVEGLGGPIFVWPWHKRNAALARASLVVNATTLGMVGQPALEIDLTALPPNAIVNDVVYTPLRTPLLGAAVARGLSVIDGLGMLLHQARPAFAAWFGVDPEVTADLRDFLQSVGESWS
jgi:shikimate dehydrogenase